MTKAELLSSLNGKSRLKRKDIMDAAELFLSGIKWALAQGTSIELRGFGTFDVKVRKGRDNARNPKTGEIVSVRPHGVVVFRPGQELKKLVWSLPEDQPFPDKKR